MSSLSYMSLGISLRVFGHGHRLLVIPPLGNGLPSFALNNQLLVDPIIISTAVRSMLSLYLIVIMVQKLLFGLRTMHLLSVFHIPRTFLRGDWLFVFNLREERLRAYICVSTLLLRGQLSFWNRLLWSFRTPSELFDQEIFLLLSERRLQVLYDCYRLFPFEVLNDGLASLGLLF